jgi:hypothetical protein
MAIGFPTKANWAAGDVLTASAQDDLAGTLNLLNPTAKGNLISASAANTPALLTVGSDGSTLVANSASATGMAWGGQPYAQPVLNSAMQIWQRGTSFTSSNGNGLFAADRWQIYSGGTGFTFSRQATNDSTNLPFIQYCLRIARDATNTATVSPRTYQNVETVNSIPYAGKTITLSFYARAGANFSAASSILHYEMRTGTGTDQNGFYSGYTGSLTPISVNQAITTSWVRYSATATLSSTATEMAFDFEYAPVGTAGANDYFEITGVQIDLGSVALPFRTYAGTLQGELAACQRYFIASLNGYGNAQNTSNAHINFSFPVVMRTTPTVATPAAAVTLFDPKVGNTTQSAANASLDSASSYGASVLMVNFTGLTAANNYFFTGNTSIQFSAEL